MDAKQIPGIARRRSALHSFGEAGRSEGRDQKAEIGSQKSESGGRSLTSDLCPLTSGFSLVEISLALAVMAIGVLSIMSLFPAGLDQNMRSIADTHAAFFAEEVFAGLHSKAETNWANLEQFDLPVASSNMWDYGTNIFATGTNIATNVYSFRTFEDHALRYRLVVTNAAAAGGLLKTATLFVWPGEFGRTNDPAVFYAEFFRFKP